jgi:predicted nucleotidyltransferase
MNDNLDNLRYVLASLREDGKVLLAYMFGSYATGNQHVRSDIDLAVYLAVTDEEERTDIIDSILMSSDCHIDLLLLDDEEESPFIIQQALKGVALVSPEREVFYSVAGRALHEAESIRARREAVTA